MAIEPSLENLQTRVLVGQYEREARQKRLAGIKRELQEGARKPAGLTAKDANGKEPKKKIWLI